MNDMAYIASRALENKIAIAENNDLNTVFVPLIMMKEILAILKEQEAIKPKITSAEQRCGNCNKVIEMDGWKSCPWCGKPIAWSEWWTENSGQAVKWNDN